MKFKIVDNKDNNNNEPLNFLKDNKINIKNIKIVDLEKNNLKENLEKNKEQKDKIEKLQNLISEDDIENLIETNQIKEEQYNQMLYLKNISKFAKQDIQEEIEEDL